MEGIMAVRDLIRDFLRKYDEIISPVFRFILYFITFMSIKGMYGYSELFGRFVVIFLLSVICALVSDKLSVLIAGMVVLINTLTVSKEMALVYLMVFVAMYCLYIRLFSESAWVLLLVPVLCMLKLKFAAAIIVAIFVGAIGMVPAAFGLVLFYMAKYTQEINDILASATEETDFSVFDYMKDQLIGNHTLLLEIVVFAAVIAITSIIYNIQFNYSWYIAIGVGGLLMIIFFAVGGTIIESDVSMGEVILGSIIGIVVSLVVQVVKRLVDYSRKEKVQFEDDEYYYYVTAVPKVVGNKKKAEFDKKKQQKTENDSEAAAAVSNAVRRNTNNAQRSSANNGQRNNTNGAKKSSTNNAQRNSANNAQRNSANNAQRNYSNNAQNNNGR